MDDSGGSSIASANTRMSKVKRFLAKPPKAAALLRLIAASEEGEAQVPLGEWQAEEVTPELALEVLAILDDHTKEVGGHVLAQLAWVTPDGKVVSASTLKRQANHVMADSTAIDTPENINAQLTGDVRAQSVQAQRILEVMSRLYMTGMAGLLAHSERLVTRQSEMLESLASRLGYAERRADEKSRELDDLLDAIRAARDESAPAESNSAQERAMKLLEAIAPQLLAQLMAPKPANTQTSGESAA